MGNQAGKLYLRARLSEDGQMQTIDATKFSECCLKLLDSLDHDGLVITKDGKPIAHLFPYERTDAELIVSLRHKIEVTGDIICTGADWNAGAQS